MITRLQMIKDLMDNEKDFDDVYYNHLMNCRLKELIVRHHSAFLYLG